MMASWNIGVPLKKLHYEPARIPANVTYKTTEPKREFIEQVVNEHITVEGISFDINYLQAGEVYPELPKTYDSVEDIIDGFIAVSAPGVSFFRHDSDYNTNVGWVRIKNVPDKGDVVVSIVVDRWHDNVKFVFREKKNLDPSKDRADFIPGFIGSYPNYFFVLDASDLPDFLEILDQYDGSPTSVERTEKYGVNRAKENFWEVYDWFQNEFNNSLGEMTGIIDLNRYYYLASEE
jgi:hypothetical protein